jgi:hypothetical protein
MNFTYQGFTLNDGMRCFTFWSTKTGNNPIGIFSIEVDLLLLSRIRVPVQEGPMFCLQMLNAASLAGLEFVERLHNYRLVEEDFRHLLIEREKRAAEKASKKHLRKPIAKHSAQSSLVLGPNFQAR